VRRCCAAFDIVANSATKGELPMDTEDFVVKSDVY
jgi:hypothetical protein